MTLVEVVAATLLVGTLVTASLTARARYVTAMKTAMWQITATEIARNMLTDWRLEEADMKVEGRGVVEGRPGWAWSRSAEIREVADGVSSKIVTLKLRRHIQSAPNAPWYQSFSFIADIRVGETG
jgi:Tfp pilus assembly protein PilV